MKIQRLACVFFLLHVSLAQNGYQNALEMLENSIDENADPCTDWFQFSCGSWLKNNPIPEGYSSSSPLGNLGITAGKQLNDAMAKIDLSNSIHAVQQGKMYHDLCKVRDSPSAADMQNYFVRLYDKIQGYGGFPALTPNWNGPVGGKTFGSSSALMGHLLGTLGVKTFLHASVDPDWQRPQKWACVLHDGGFVQTTEAEIVDLFKRFAQANQVNTDPDRLKQHAAEILNLENKLRKAAESRPSLDNVTEAFYYTKDFDLPYNAFNLGQLQQRWWFIDWLELFKTMAQDNVPEAQLITNSYVVPFPEILDQLRDTIILTPDDVIQDFLLWRFVQKFAYLVPVTGVVERPNKKACAATENTLSNAVSRPFVEQWMQLYSQKSISDLDDMVVLILDALHAMFATLDWMTPNSLQDAYAKINKMGRNIAYPQWVLDDQQLNKAYEKLELSMSDDPLTLAFKLHRFQAYTHINKINIDSDFALYNFQNHYLYTTNAWYQPWYNSITIPAGIFEYPMFYEGWPKAVSYGAIGAVLGHEITHGFDTTGVQWDSEGAKNYWMDDESSTGFNSMAQCVIDQYSAVCYPNLTRGDMRQGKCREDRECTCVNGQSTKAEDIADSGGTLAAYFAYKKFVSNNGQEKRLSGKLSKYSMDQVFFMSFAHNWCSNETPASLKRAAEAVSDLRGHSPEPIRGVETLKNLVPFAEAFKCKTGRVMAPKDHCKVWIGHDLHSDFKF